MAMGFLRAFANGSVLASVILSLLEGSFLLLSRRRDWMVWSQIVVPPVALAGLNLIGFVRVPFGIWMALVAVWNFLGDAPNWRVRILGDALTAGLALTSLWVSAQGSHPDAWMDFFTVAAIAGVTIARWKWSLGAAAVLLMASVAYSAQSFSGDALKDSITSVTAGFLLWIFVSYQRHQQELFQRRQHQAFHDALTGTKTRHSWAEWYQHDLEPRQAEGLVAALDIDDFKWINDTLGHTAGDIILQQFSTRLLHAVPRRAGVFRWGGDEFQVWIPDVEPAHAAVLANRIHRAITGDPYKVRESRLHVGVSVGFMVGRLTEATADKADQALLASKRAGKNQVQAASDGADGPAADTVGGISASLGWLAGAVHSLWENWDRPAVLTTAHGDVLYRNEAYRALAVPDHVVMPQGSRPSPSNETFSRGWRGLIEQRSHTAPDRSRWGVETILPVKLGGRIVGYWATIDDVSRKTGVRDAAAFLDEIRFATVFQPIVDIAQGRCLGYEALTRADRHGEPLDIASLFSVASDVGVVVAADLLCLRSLYQTLESIAWADDAWLFVNVNPDTISEGHFADIQDAFLERFPRIRIAWEVSERGDHQLAEAARGRVGSLSGSWVMDDFGIGNADVWRLVVWPWSWIKLDRSLIARLACDPNSVDLLRFLVDWSRARGIGLIAEGIETTAELEAVRGIGIRAGQGYFWCRPGPWESVSDNHNWACPFQIVQRGPRFR